MTEKPSTYNITHPRADGPIGVFDSGIGGLSVLQALSIELPFENFVYIADSRNAPYGERSENFIVQRTNAIVQYLRKHHDIKALVIACNTATAAAIKQIRHHHPFLPCIGVEPALKPAAKASKTQKIGVICTRSTLDSEKFTTLRRSIEQKAQFVVQACDGLAHAIELSAISPDHLPTVNRLCEKYLHAMGEFGDKKAQMDVLVLGCTHYIFAKEILQTLVGPKVVLMDTGLAIAQQTHRLLVNKNLLGNSNFSTQHSHFPRKDSRENHIRLFSTGDIKALQAAARRWLHLAPRECHEVSIF